MKVLVKWTTKYLISNQQNVTFPNHTVPNRPEKDDKVYQTHISCGGGQLDYFNS